MEKYWYNPKSAAYLSTPEAFHRFLARKGKDVTYDQVRRFVAAQPTYQKTKETKRGRASVPMLVTGPHLSQQCDLAFFATKNTQNKNVALVCADVFSSKIYAQLMQQRKTATATWNAYERLLERMKRPPVTLSTDQGREFTNTLFVREAKKRGIRTRALRTHQKAAVAENAIHRIKQQWRRVRTQTGSRDLRKHLPLIVARLNARPHSRTRIAPNDVTLANAGLVFERRYGEYFRRAYSRAHVPPKFAMGDRVRLALFQTASTSGQIGAKPAQRFSDAIYTVRRVRKTHPFTYEVVDENLRPPGRFFYDHQLVHAD